MARRPTIIDVAKLAGVSKTTVARVVGDEQHLVREETRQRVLDAIEQLDYAPNAIAGSLRSDRTYMIALSIPDITNPFWPEVARGVQDTLEREGYTVVFLNSDWDARREHNHLQMMRRNQFDGLIINPTGVVNADLSELHIPIVILSSGDLYPDFDAVSSDSKQASHTAVEHLMKLGHTRIGLIVGPARRPRSYTHQDNYRLAHQARGLNVDESLIMQSDFTQEGGFKAMQRLLELDELATAVFAANDLMALGALRAIQQQGIQVPQEISIIGMDDIYAAATTNPPLTTIAKPKYEIGNTAARWLLDHLEGRSPLIPRHELLPCVLIERGSTARRH